MPPDTVVHTGELVAFRLDSDVKAELEQLAEQGHQSLEDLLRDLARAHVAAERRRAFAAEARRQCLEAAKAARDPQSDEAEVMRWIEEVADTAGWEA